MTPAHSLIKGLLLLLLLACLVLAWFGGLSYGSQYYLVAAKRGQKSAQEYERLLLKSIELDPHAARPRIDLAALYTAQRRLEPALGHQLSAMRSYRPVTAFEQLGLIIERTRQAGLPLPKASHVRLDPQALYEKANRVQPGNVNALVRMMVRAYRAGDYTGVEGYAKLLERVDLDNPNIPYVLALSADRQGNHRAAYGFYQRVSSAPFDAEEALYSLDEVQRRMVELRPVIGNGW